MSDYCETNYGKHDFDRREWKGSDYLSCRRCGYLPSFEITMRELEALLDKARAHIPRPPPPKQALEYRARMARIDPATFVAKVMTMLEPRADPDVMPRAGKAWDAWDAERDPYKKALLQMDLALHVAGLMEQVEALSASPRRSTDS